MRRLAKIRLDAAIIRGVGQVKARVSTKFLGDVSPMSCVSRVNTRTLTGRPQGHTHSYRRSRSLVTLARGIRRGSDDERELFGGQTGMCHWEVEGRAIDAGLRQ